MAGLKTIASYPNDERVSYEIERVGRIVDGPEGPVFLDLFSDPVGDAVPLQGAAVGSIVRLLRSEAADDAATLSYEVLAPGNGALAALYEILAKNRLSPVFPLEVIKETEHWLANPGLDDPTLTDLTDRPFVTIDGATSRDLDQAVLVEVANDIEEGFVVHYALADASYYVSPGSALWRESEARAASYYLPGLMVPMLPRPLSEGLISLNPGVERRALVFSTVLDGSGCVVRTSVKRAKVRSVGKLSFERVERFYEHGDLFEDPELCQSLALLKQVGQARMRDAEERQVVRYRRTEVDAHVTGKLSRRFVATAAVRRRVESYNEQLSLLCNSEGARLLQQSSSQSYVEAVYRVHPAPEDERLSQLRTKIKALAERHSLSKDVWLWKSDQPLSDYLRQLPTEGHEGRVARAIHRQAVMVNVRSSYQQEPDAHYGVGAKSYARFSAPMRELVGIYLHAELLQALSGEGTEDKELTKLVVDRANHAKQVQKRVTNAGNLLVLDQLFEDQLQLSMERRGLKATVMGLTHGKVYVQFDEPPIDAKIRVRHIKNHRDSEQVSVTSDECTLLDGSEVICSLGDAVKVLVLGKNGERWQLSLL